MEENNGFYFITSIDIKDGDKRCVGYVETYDEAELIVTENMYDLNETCYDYVVIEHIPFGIYQYDYSAKWFKYDYVNDKYVPLDACPDGYKNQIGFAIG